MGKFIVNSGEITICDYNTPQVDYDQYGNCIDDGKRIVINAAGEIMDFEPDAKDGMLLNNGMVAINYNYDYREMSYKIFDCSNLKLISKHEGYASVWHGELCDKHYSIIESPVGSGIKSFVRKIHFIKKNTIDMYSCSKDLITFRENDETFEFTIIPYNLTISTKKIEVKGFWFNIYLYENFIITDWDVICIDDPSKKIQIGSHIKEC
jgi:hypothetical protein